MTCSVLNMLFCNLLFGAIAVAFSCMARDAFDRGQFSHLHLNYLFKIFLIKFIRLDNVKLKVCCCYRCLDSAMVQLACRNGHVIYKNLGLSPTYDQWSFFACNKFCSLNNVIPMLRSVATVCFNKLAQNYQGHV